MTENPDIHQLADNELCAEGRRTVLEQMEQSPALKAEYQAVLQLRETLQKNCGGVHCPDTWRAAVGRLDGIDRAKRAESFVGKWQYAMCGVLLTAIVGFGLVTRQANAGRTVNVAEVPAMVSSLSPLAGSGVSRAATEKPQIGPITIPLDEMQVLGLSDGTANGKPFSRADLRDRLGGFTLLAFPDCSGLAGMEQNMNGYSTGTLMGVPCVGWTKDGYAFLVAGNRDTLLLQSVADKLRSDR